MRSSTFLCGFFVLFSLGNVCGSHQEAVDGGEKSPSRYGVIRRYKKLGMKDESSESSEEDDSKGGLSRPGLKLPSANGQVSKSQKPTKKTSDQAPFEWISAHNAENDQFTAPTRVVGNPSHVFNTTDIPSRTLQPRHHVSPPPNQHTSHYPRNVSLSPLVPRNKASKSVPTGLIKPALSQNTPKGQSSRPTTQAKPHQVTTPVSIPKIVKTLNNEWNPPTVAQEIPRGATGSFGPPGPPGTAPKTQPGVLIGENGSFKTQLVAPAKGSNGVIHVF
ncbi:hypothetical protein L596_025021 [Steinernema carpocapsae]|uniref:Uncharacterized protein n=1 Tax=Steinernema carpocapsae TaxID=34508 RepID=A0A4U5M6Q5_STECR|nr:hypothetical protein L596_025021 [Steinernema carpocapsae]